MGSQPPCSGSPSVGTPWQPLPPAGLLAETSFALHLSVLCRMERVLVRVFGEAIQHISQLVTCLLQQIVRLLVRDAPPAGISSQLRQYAGARYAPLVARPS